MQQRRLRPGDVLDDYCPRERRITDHAIVAMIDDEIKQTRCVSCDTEHEYKQAKVPPQRRKKAPPALFTQVLDGLQGPARIAPTGASGSPDADDDAPSEAAPPSFSARTQTNLAEPDRADSAIAQAQAPAAPSSDDSTADEAPERDSERAAEEGPVRRPLIRAQLPRPEGQQPPARDLPDFTIRQPSTGRANRPGGGGHGTRPGGRRRGGGQQQGQGGATRFGSQSRPNQFGRSGERRPGGGRHDQGPGHGSRQGQGQGQGHGHGGRPNRGGRRGSGGGKKH